jgi:RNA polymerase sigma-70 factor (ECF subfamily)
VHRATTDEQLIKTFRRGDDCAFNELYNRYSAHVFTFLLSLGGSVQDCEDAAQTTWRKAIDKIDTYHGRKGFQPWLFQIAHRTWLDRVRSAWDRRHVPVGQGQDEDFVGLPIDESMTRSAVSVSDQAIAREESALLYAALEHLPDRMRQTMLLYVDGGMNLREISEAMECSIGTTSWRFHEAKKRLKDKLER